jgi:hypothetical protein
MTTYKKKIEFKFFIILLLHTNQSKLTMAYSKRLKSDPIFVSNLQDFINALFNGDTPTDLLNTSTTKLNMLKFYAGDEYNSFKDFDRSLKSHTKRVAKKEKLTEFIKTHNLETHAHSAYAIFLKENTEIYKKKHSEMPHKELRSLMSKKWSEMTDKEKKPYEAKYHKQKEDFIERVRQIDPEYVALFDKSQAPKARLHAYTLFVTEQMKIIRAENPDIMNKSVMKMAGSKWKTLSDSEKKKYYDQCGEAMPDKKDTRKKTVKKASAAESDVEEEPKPKSKPKAKKVESDSEDEPKPKPKAKKVESDSEDEPKPKHKGKKVESDSEDEPVVKSKASKKKVESDSEEEAPTPKKKAAAVVKSKGKPALDTVLSNSDQSDSD